MNMPSRVAFNLFGKDIYWYGVIMATAMIIAVGLAYSEERRKKLKKDTVIDMCLCIIPAGIVGARLYYVLFELESYLKDPITILYIWRGGLAIYGAVIAAYVHQCFRCGGILLIEIIGIYLLRRAYAPHARVAGGHAYNYYQLRLAFARGI